VVAPYRAVAPHILAAGAQAWRDDLYEFRQRGIPPLRAAIVQKLARENNIHVDVERARLGDLEQPRALPGDAPVASTGDEVLVPDPATPRSP
jgi:aspartate aminotransferase